MADFMSLRYLKLIISYDGTRYAGWQRQINGMSIQQKMEEAWLSVTGEKRTITSSGRTDAGVHARGQVCSFRTAVCPEKYPCKTILRAFNARTPTDISILSVEETFEGFNAINHSIRKTYCYSIQAGRIRDPMIQQHVWFVPHIMDVAAMRQAAVHIVGQQDFASFQCTGSVRRSTVRHVMDLTIDDRRRGPFHDIEIRITADGFLYNMVRAIVGTLAMVGKGREEADWVRWVIDQRDRELAGQTAPARGLSLDHVVYADDASGGIHQREKAFWRTEFQNEKVIVDSLATGDSQAGVGQGRLKKHDG